MAMPRPMLALAAGLVAVAVPWLLQGCGSGPGPTPAPPGPKPGPVECPALLKRGHCTSCYFTGSDTVCRACSGQYKLLERPERPELSCSYDCRDFKPAERPSLPEDATSHNGVEWPGMCIEDSVSRFFTIGDWGGLCGWGKDNTCRNDTKPAVCACGPDCGDPGKPCPMPNRPASIKEIDGVAQRLVADRMRERQEKLVGKGTPARFIVNVGDNFYPGGVDFHCGVGDKSATASQFEQMWKAMYVGELRKLEWWSILGNHDYGGVCYTKGWDQQIFYTWHDEKWLMPGQYWRRSVQYKNFKADFFFLDGNVFDAKEGTDLNHDICSDNPGGGKESKKCSLDVYPGDGGNCGAPGPHEPNECRSWFKKLWEKNNRWIKQVLPRSDADWQIIVQHYPPSFNLGFAPDSYMDWSKFLEPMGVDLYISGHTHFQKVYYGDMGPSENMGKTAWVITGGGGGITSQMLPVPDGNDDAYGFMEVEISLESLSITAFSHGGVEGREIIRNVTTVQPVPRQSYSQLVASGLLSKAEVPESELGWEDRDLLF